MLPSYKFKKVKPDMSPYLFHFTKGENAQDVLRKILEEEKLISEKHEYICFTSSPLTSLKQFFQTTVNGTGLPMYMPFGIGFSRDIMYEKYGARNVIYSTKEEIEYLKSDPLFAWRCEELDIHYHDFEYLREWRTPGNIFDFKDFDKEHIIIITADKESLKDCAAEQDWNVDFVYEHEVGGTFPYIIWSSKRKWKGFSLDEVEKFPDDFILSGATKEQKTGEDL